MMKKYMRYTVLVAVGLLPFSGMSADYNLSDIDGVRIQDNDLNGTGDSVQRNQLWAGNIAGFDWGILFVYDLPTLGLGEQDITSANFSVLQDGNSGSPDLLVSVFTRSDAAVQAADYQGAGTGYTSSIVDLETGFGGANTTHNLTIAGQDALVSFLNTNKDDDYLFIRIRANGTPVGGNAYKFGTTSGADQTTAVTTLSFTAVPEPSAYALIGGLLALSCVMVRRRV